MKTVSEISELRQIIKTWHQQGLTVAFVPTMGNLHDGHISLVTEAHKHADKVVSSIFVNPMQFGESEDLDNYPRTFAEDQEKLAAEDVHYLFTPKVEEMYPNGIENHTRVNVDKLSNMLCGIHRPVHFEGVCTVVSKLLNLVQPNSAIFGEKDYQQYELVRLMVKNYFIACRVCCVDTVREPSGLALSSRLARLDNAGMEKAQAFATIFHEGKNNPLDEIKQQLMQIPVNVEYIEKLNDRLYIAVDIDGVRLIDNVKV